MIRNIASFIIVSFFLTLSACNTPVGYQSQDRPAGTETPPPSTATIIWFPPSTTPSPQPFASQQPTAEQKPGVGNILLKDDFTSASLWNIATSDQASVQVSGNRLTIAAQPGIEPVLSFRKDVIFSDFYAEITAKPSLCRDADDYGFLFRAPNNVAYYRFTLACNGTTGVDRVSVGRPRVLQAPTLSGDVPPGPPGEVRLGVWADGPNLHFFLNGRYQFGVTDRNYLTGGLGVFAQAGGNTPITITFSDLVVRQVNVQLPLVTPIP